MGDGGDFYATVAQVIPVLLLAIFWETDYLKRLKALTLAEERQRTFWRKPAVRAWAITMSVTALVAEGTMIVVLSGEASPGALARWIGIAGVAALAVTLLVRLTADILEATSHAPR